MMTIATMADRTLPLAERVASALAAAARGIRSDEIASISELLADVAAADRLARACSAWYAAVDESPLPEHGMSKATAAEYEMDQAEEAYRARMAQGVARGQS